MPILTKSATPGEVQVEFCRDTIGKNSLGGTVIAFSLAGCPKLTTVVAINTEHAKISTGDKIHLLVMEVLLHYTSGDLAWSKKL